MPTCILFWLIQRTYMLNGSQDFVKDLDFECKNAVFEYKTAGCRPPLKGCSSR